MPDQIEERYIILYHKFEIEGWFAIKQFGDFSNRVSAQQVANLLIDGKVPCYDRDGKTLPKGSEIKVVLKRSEITYHWLDETT